MRSGILNMSFGGSTSEFLVITIQTALRPHVREQLLHLADLEGKEKN
jgi:hypothetical protein